MTGTLTPSTLRLRPLLRETAGAHAAQRLRHLVEAAADRLPMPAGGVTLKRWAALAEVAADDLSLAKLYEGHTDALAILQELGFVEPQAEPRAEPPQRSTWGVWAAEMPSSRVEIEQDGGQLRLHGTKFWCSGAEHVDQGLLTAWYPDGRGPQLAAVDMKQSRIKLHTEAWQAVGMAGSASVDVTFDGAAARPVGQPGDYLSRAGFWQGGAGIAACWYGGARALGEALRLAALTADSSAKAATPQAAFRFAALGQVDLALSATAALLRETARWIDQHPRANAQEHALRARLAAEHCAQRVLDEVGRSLGATPFCRDARFARRAADLPVFIRQSHGERDLAALGGCIASRPEPLPNDEENTAWTL